MLRFIKNQACSSMSLFPNMCTKRSCTYNNGRCSLIIDALHKLNPMTPYRNSTFTKCLNCVALGMWHRDNWFSSRPVRPWIMLQGMMGRMHRIAATHKTYPSPRAESTHAHQMRAVGEMARIKMAAESPVPMDSMGFLQRTRKPSFASTKKKACMRHNMQDSE